MRALALPTPRFPRTVRTCPTCREPMQPLSGPRDGSGRRAAVLRCLRCGAEDELRVERETEAA